MYKGQKWDNMSGSERLMVSTAIVRKLNPECGFVLLDKLEQMDLQTLQEFGSWLFFLAFAGKKIGDYVDECREEQEEWEEERRDEVFAAWIRSGSLKEG